MTSADLTRLIRNVSADLLAETAAVDLIRSGLIGREHVQITRVDAFRHGYVREIDGICYGEERDDTGQAELTIQAVREGITDMIPPGLIYQPAQGRERSEEVMLADAEAQELASRAARQFFLPFEIEADRQRILLALLEDDALTDPFSTFQHELWDIFWPDFILKLSDSQKHKLLRITFRLHALSGDLRSCRDAFEDILGYPVELTEHEGHGNWKNTPDLPGGLGQQILGVDWVPSGTFTYSRIIRVTVGPVHYLKMPEFRQEEPRSANVTLIHFLCELMFPIEKSWEIEIVPDEAIFLISDKKSSAMLGYSTVLG